MSRLLFWSLLVVVCLAPLPLGGNRPFAWSLLALCSGLLLIAWGGAALRAPREVTLSPRRTLPFALPFLLFSFWIVVQSSGSMPAAWHHPLWQQAGAALGRPLSGAIGLSPDQGLTTLLRLLSYAAVFWLALHLAHDGRRARIAVWSVAVAVAVYAAYGLAMKLSGTDQILWLDRWAYRDSVTGPFVNRNSFATYLGLGLVAQLALLLDLLVEAVPRRLPLRLALVRFLDRLGFGAWALLTMLLVSGTALLLTGSRGGLLATLVGVVALLVSARFTHRRGRGRAWQGVVWLTLLGGLLLLMVSGSFLITRSFDAPGGASSRLEILALGRDAIAAAPLTGHGLGSFPSLFYLFDDGRFGTLAASMQRAHNSYLEVAMEAGLPALLLLLAPLLLVLVSCLRGVRERRRNAVFPLIGVAVTSLVAVHSALDFSLQMPGVSLTYLLLAGVAVAQSWRRRAAQPPPASSPGGERPVEGPQRLRLVGQ